MNRRRYGSQDFMDESEACEERRHEYGVVKVIGIKICFRRILRWV